MKDRDFTHNKGKISKYMLRDEAEKKEEEYSRDE
jgi:hypothetical protein